ncbi:MAG: hypothetical protein V1707_03345 [bacterium]
MEFNIKINQSASLGYKKILKDFEGKSSKDVRSWTVSNNHISCLVNGIFVQAEFEVTEEEIKFMVSCGDNATQEKLRKILVNALSTGESGFFPRLVNIFK